MFSAIFEHEISISSVRYYYSHLNVQIIGFFITITITITILFNILAIAYAKLHPKIDNPNVIS